MEVILIERMANLGSIGDVVRVKNGYARNYLIPQGKALRATKNNVAYFEAKRAEIEARNAELRADAEKVAQTVEGAIVTLIRQASDDGRLYGSVNARDVAVALQAKGHKVDRKHVALTAVIKEVGVYVVKVALHPEVVVDVKVNIARSEAEAEEALKGSSKKKAKPAAEETVDAAEENAA